jgi:type IX secretion system PorP/SprF family membrane protein
MVIGLMRKWFVLMWVACLAGFGAFAQDPQFSQFYASPLFLNPAFAGGGEEARAGINYRNQWPNLPSSWTTFTAWGDIALPDINSGVGILLMNDREGRQGLQSNAVHLQYAYQLPLDEEWSFRAGISTGYMRRHVDFGQLVFASQLDPTGAFDPNLPSPINSGLQTSLFTAGVGGLLYSKKFWFGGSAFHVNEPDQSLLDEVSPLPMRSSLHMGFKVPLNPGARKYDLLYTFRERSWMPMLSYRSQAGWQQMDIGSYFFLEPLLIGAWYRGMPLPALNTLPYNQSLILLVGLSYESLSIGYSYDYSLSQLGGGTGGAHEFSMSFLIPVGDPRRPKINKRAIPLPKF